VGEAASGQELKGRSEKYWGRVGWESVLMNQTEFTYKLVL